MVARLDGSTVVTRCDRVAIEYLVDDDASERLFRATERHAGLRVTNLPPLAHRIEDRPRLRASFPSDGNRQCLALGFDDLAVELRKERERLVDQRRDRERWRAARGSRRLCVSGGGDEERD